MDSEQDLYEVALGRYQDVLSLLANQGAMDEPSPAHTEYAGSYAIDMAIREEVPTGIYMHFKSTDQEPKYYAVEEIGQFVDSGPYLVGYRSLYGVHALRLGFRQLVGPNPVTGKQDAFLEPVDRLEYRGPRFVLVERATCPSHLSALIENYRSKKAA